MEDREPGTIETLDYVFEHLKQFGIPAGVWDDVHDELFQPPFGTLAQPLQELFFELEVGKKSSGDYPRPDGTSDHDFVRVVLKQAAMDFDAQGEDHARLMSDNSWTEDSELGVRFKPTKDSIN
jgi:hypothetical protein